MEAGDRVEIIYMAENGALTKRMIKVLSQTDTHIKALCYAKRSQRTFKKASILGCYKRYVQ
ncbi:WYL domain-containing protein [Aureibacillus halotolerans]|uniref:WYL domain-containing protein n=1 Tax=Aureibacillus halotolerans TaxID=1508390 RepID=A0A4R6TZL0_9BACI|nr:WYL domain-containing protein [Aureibacillus halotolerans]TDQ36234.1 hypothetical protein EV213_11923 [Aureibacillus halotolerans]